MSAERRTFSPNHNNHGVTHNRSEVPVIKIERVKKLGVFIATGGNGHNVDTTDLVKVQPDTVHDRRRTIKGICIFPLTKKPLVPVYMVSCGGGRIRGGGTSEEALRRARRKAKRPGKKLPVSTSRKV